MYTHEQITYRLEWRTFLEDLPDIWSCPGGTGRLSPVCMGAQLMLSEWKWKALSWASFQNVP